MPYLSATAVVIHCTKRRYIKCRHLYPLIVTCWLLLILYEFSRFVYVFTSKQPCSIVFRVVIRCDAFEKHFSNSIEFTRFTMFVVIVLDNKFNIFWSQTKWFTPHRMPFQLESAVLEPAYCRKLGGQSQSGQAIKLFQITPYVNDFQTLNNTGS